MVELAVNSINGKYKDISKVLVNTDVPEGLFPDTYNNFPIDTNYIDHGYIKLTDGSAHKMFVACGAPNDLRPIVLYLSKDGVVWASIVLPSDYIAKVYNKIVIYDGDVYVLYDDTVIRIFNFDIVDIGAELEVIHNDIYDIMINDHKLCMLTYNGVYKIGHDNSTPEFIDITAEFPYESFVPSLNGELIILGYGSGYPLFIVYDGSPHIVLCKTKCTIQTAISYNDKILCYTNDGTIIDVHKAYELLNARETVYDGYNWSGTVTYHHSYFWICYTENDNDGNAYTVISKSSNGINFDPDVKIPHVSNKDGVLCWGDPHTLCVCAGSLYMLKSSENYSSYGAAFIKHFENVPIEEDGSVRIDCQISLSDFDSYTFSPYLCNDDQLASNISIRYDKVPHFEGTEICFKLRNQDLTGLHINAYCYGVRIIY
jgi:hypothetical protein